MNPPKWYLEVQLGESQMEVNMTESAKNSRQSIPYGRKFAKAMKMAENEPTLSGFLHATILNFERLEMAIASHLSEKLANSEIGARTLCEVFEEAFSDNKAVSEAMRADIVAHFDRDPACRSLSRSGALL